MYPTKHVQSVNLSLPQAELEFGGHEVQAKELLTSDLYVPTMHLHSAKSSASGVASKVFEVEGHVVQVKVLLAYDLYVPTLHMQSANSSLPGSEFEFKGHEVQTSDPL